MPDFPVEWPGAWQNLPVEVRRMLTQRLLDRSLELHEGSEGLVKWLFAGSDFPGKKRSETYAMRGRDFWPLVVEETKKFIAARAARANPPSETPAP